MAQGLCSGRIPIEWSYVRAGVDLVGELLLEAVGLIESCAGAGAGAGAGADLGPDKIRDRPHAAAGHHDGRTVGLVGWAGRDGVGPDEAWKEAHAQAWDSAGRVPGAWKTGLA